jgi:hypothetical protein
MVLQLLDRDISVSVLLILRLPESRMNQSRHELRRLQYSTVYVQTLVHTDGIRPDLSVHVSKQLEHTTVL